MDFSEDKRMNENNEFRAIEPVHGRLSSNGGYEVAIAPSATLFEYGRLLLQRKGVLLIAAVLGTGLGLLVSMPRTRVYQAHTTLEIQGFNENLLNTREVNPTATGNISVTAGLAIMAFIMVQVAGMRENGVLGHFKNLLPRGIPVALVPLMIVVELMGMLTKPFALCIRLFANMTAGHVVILSLISLVFILKSVWVGAFLSVPFALFISAIELLVIFLQAYIFTMLTSLFIGMSVHPQH